MGRIDSKAAAGTIGAAVAVLVWTLLAAFVDAVKEMDPQALATASTATATILAAVLAYLTPNEASPLPGDGVGASPEPMTALEVAREAERTG